MQASSIDTGLMARVPALPPFHASVLDMLADLSRTLMASPRAKAHPDVATFAFWCRRAATEQLRPRFADGHTRLGRGLVFHIAPGNVPVNFAYTLAAGLLTGNANIVRLPSKDFEQVDIIRAALDDTLTRHPHMAQRIALVRYGHDRETNDRLSAAADVRVVWGGDRTIAELRQSPLRPRATEITFADRYSLAVIDSDAYLQLDAARVARDFYNDTYLSDQNACTSPRVVAWTGTRRAEAKQTFWAALHAYVSPRYQVQAVQAVSKLTSAYRAAAALPGARIIAMPDNLITRVQVPSADAALMELKDNSGYFFEVDTDNVEDLRPLCDDTRCQTLSHIGPSAALTPLLALAPRGIDRVVPVGHTMDFDLIWDGHDLHDRLTRIITIA